MPHVGSLHCVCPHNYDRLAFPYINMSPWMGSQLLGPCTCSTPFGLQVRLSLYRKYHQDKAVSESARMQQCMYTSPSPVLQARHAVGRSSKRELCRPVCAKRGFSEDGTKQLGSVKVSNVPLHVVAQLPVCVSA